MNPLDLPVLSTVEDDFSAQLDRLLDWQDGEASAGIELAVREIVQTVRERGDEALVEYTNRFDRRQVDAAHNLEIGTERLEEAVSRVPVDQLRALQGAAERIRNYHEYQKESSWSFTDPLGNELGQKITPLERVGVYVPGGQASYPSSVLMTLIPAAVAGVDELIVLVPTPDDRANDLVLAALHIAGAHRVFSIGGAQAVAALAYGTGLVPRVDKIVGPGGAYVAEAKRQVFGHVGIDIIAGPSEILVVADGSTDPEWVAMDLFSQAEHDAAAQSIMLCPDRAYIEKVRDLMSDRLPQMVRADIIRASLEGRGALIQTRDMSEAITVANRIAPEHLELHVSNPDDLIDDVRHAGAIFCGAHSGETLGDYVAGPSHVLPTFGTARFGSPLGVYDFVKRSSVIRMSPAGAAELADIAVPLAEAEGLHAHARAAAVRAGQS